ncbi:MAG TPA: DUF1697 domain-containing protein [bacterium]|jgi:uncharacterized protein (DUF1697 family)|nr:DUF1697 domain-containing protein [bacterium]
MSYLALLRGINVGGKHSLPMQDLAAMLESLGCAQVRTYIQSGNAVFEASEPAAAKLPAALQAAILKKAGFEAPVVLRSCAQMAAVLKANPFLAKGADPGHLHVGFMADKPSAAALKALDPGRSPGDAFAVSGWEIYLHFPKGSARTKLTNAYFDSALKTVCTMRNWRTVQALAAMASGA